jgi:hypothetical protein
MNPVLRRALPFLSILLGLIACTYKPEEEFYNDIPKTEPEVSISLNSYSASDTIYLWNDASFTYSLQQGAGNLERVEVLLGDNVVYSHYGSRNGLFTLNRYNYLRTGTFTLKVQFVASSGTGSLADQVGAEKIEVWRTWTVVVDVDPPPKPDLRLSIENGFLKLTWNKYSKPNFRQYFVSRSDPSNYTQKYITDPNDTSWIDSTYVGSSHSDVQYYVSVQAIDEYTQSNEYISKRDRYPLTAGVFQQQDSTLHLRWPKCKYLSAFQEYEVSHNGVVLYRTTNPDDTVATVKLSNIMFGYESSVHMNVVPRYKTVYSARDNEVRVTLGNRIKHNGTMFYKRDRDQYVCRAGNYFYLYDKSLQPVDSVPGATGAVYVPYSGDNVFFSSADYGMINLTTKVKKSKPGFSGRSWFSVSGNGLVTYETSSRNNGRTVYSMSVTDLVNDVQIHSDGQYTSVYATLSDDGKYFLKNPSRKVWTVNNGVATEGSSTFSGFREFRADKPNEIIMAPENNSVAIRSATTGQTLRTLALPNVPRSVVFSSYDPVTGTMVWYHEDSRTIYLINIETGATKSYRSLGTRLVNGVLFYGDYYIKIL